MRHLQGRQRELESTASDDSLAFGENFEICFEFLREQCGILVGELEEGPREGAGDGEEARVHEPVPPKAIFLCCRPYDRMDEEYADEDLNICQIELLQVPELTPSQPLLNRAHPNPRPALGVHCNSSLLTLLPSSSLFRIGSKPTEPSSKQTASTWESQGMKSHRHSAGSTHATHGSAVEGAPWQRGAGPSKRARYLKLREGRAPSYGLARS